MYKSALSHASGRLRTLEPQAMPPAFIVHQMLAFLALFGTARAFLPLALPDRLASGFFPLKFESASAKFAVFDLAGFCGRRRSSRVAQ